jgi:hypothetical protein
MLSMPTPSTISPTQAYRRLPLLGTRKSCPIRPCTSYTNVIAGATIITPKLTHSTAGAPDTQFASEMRGKSHGHLQWDCAIVAKGYYCDVVAEGEETRCGSLSWQTDAMKERICELAFFNFVLCY